MKTLGSIAFLVCAYIIFTIISFLSFFINIVRKGINKEDLKEYLKICAIAEDQRAGSYMYSTEDWTISGYTYYLHKKGNNIATMFMKIIDFCASPFEKEHCKKVYEKENWQLHNGGAKLSKDIKIKDY